jgi:hypothetical protein
MHMIVKYWHPDCAELLIIARYVDMLYIYHTLYTNNTISKNENTMGEYVSEQPNWQIINSSRARLHVGKQ